MQITFASHSVHFPFTLIETLFSFIGIDPFTRLNDQIQGMRDFSQIFEANKSVHPGFKETYFLPSL